jgi:hypothetical protein
MPHIEWCGKPCVSCEDVCEAVKSTPCTLDCFGVDEYGIPEDIFYCIDEGCCAIDEIYTLSIVDWYGYLQYLTEWLRSHYRFEFDGTAPTSLYEWRNNVQTRSHSEQIKDYGLNEDDKLVFVIRALYAIFIKSQK